MYIFLMLLLQLYVIHFMIMIVDDHSENAESEYSAQGIIILKV